MGGRTGGNNALSPGSTHPCPPASATLLHRCRGHPADRRARARPAGTAMSGRDWRAFDAELSARVPELAVELLGRPTFRAGQEWRWGRKGSLSVVIGGAKAGMWFDHEAGDGGGFVDLVGRDLGLSRGDALDWTADRIGMGRRHRSTRTHPAPPILSTNTPVSPQAQPGAEASPQTPRDEADPAVARAEEAAALAERIWASARPAPDDHSYLTAKKVAPLGLRMDARGHLVVPLQDGDGRLHSVETIAPDGAKRYLAGGAKRGHFAVVGAEPGPLAEPTAPLLICEGWATGASLHIATGHTVIAAMDAGNLMPVAEALRARFPDGRHRPGRRQRREARPRQQSRRRGGAQGRARRRRPSGRAGQPGRCQRPLLRRGAGGRRGARGRCGPDTAATADLSGAGPYARRGPRRARRGHRRLHGRDPGLLGRRRGGAGGGQEAPTPIAIRWISTSWRGRRCRRSSACRSTWVSARPRARAPPSPS